MQHIQVGFDHGSGEFFHRIPPHPDIELGYRRNPLDYFVTLPAGGIDDQTGLILVIPGFGDRADTAYQRDKLRPYLADKYNCLAIGVNYFGIKERYAFPEEIQYSLPDPQAFIQAAQQLYGLAAHEIVHAGTINLERLAHRLRQQGITKAPIELRLVASLREGETEYESFGFLPAVDHLTVLGDALRRYPVNPRRLIAFGSSYGGYIALLLGKFAPHTFAMIVDNSGFTVSSVADMVTNEVPSYTRRQSFHGIDFPITKDNPWRIFDETSPNYLADSHRMIRSLLTTRHITHTKTRFHLFHSKSDKIIPIHHKDAFASLLQAAGISVTYSRIGESDLDGRIFKTLTHGMEASLRGLFDLSAQRDTPDLAKPDPQNDFTANTRHHFPCGPMTYVFQFQNTYDVTVTRGGA